MDQRQPDHNRLEPVEEVGPLGDMSNIDRRRASVGLVIGPLLLVTPFSAVTMEAHRLPAVWRRGILGCRYMRLWPRSGDHLVIVCQQCGTRNPDDFEHCASCGAALRSAPAIEPTIIDVSDDQAEIVTGDEGRERTFRGTYVGPARVYVTGGGSRSCLIIVVVALLLACCVCVGWWTVADNIFF